MILTSLLQQSCGVAESIDFPVWYTHNGANPLYLGYKLPVEDPSVEGGNFVLKKAYSTCLEISFLLQSIYVFSGIIFSCIQVLIFQYYFPSDSRRGWVGF